MAGEDELNISASLSGDLAEALRRVEQRLDSLEGKLDAAGRSGERAGDRISSGADDATEALARTERAADAAAGELSDVERQAGRAAGELDDVGRSGARAAAGLEGAEQGAEGAAEALSDVERAARSAERQLDDAGDEAAQAGAQAAASSFGWNKLWAAMDRNERLSRRFTAAQNAMRWNRWTSDTDGLATAWNRLGKVDFLGMAKKVGKVGSAFGGLKLLKIPLLILTIVSALYSLVAALAALGAGAVGAIGGIGSLLPGLLALGPVLAGLITAMIAFKVAAEPVKDELQAIKDQFSGIGNAIAQGGLRAALVDMSKRVGKFAENVRSGMTIIGGALGKSVRAVTDYIAEYETLKNLGTVWVGLGQIVERFGGLFAGVMNFIINLIRASLPAGLLLTEMMEQGAQSAGRWMQQMTDSGKATAYISGAFDKLRYAVGILVDFIVGLYRVFRIAAQESGWMATSLHDAAQRFKEFTGTAEGQNKIREYFAAAQPAVREVLLILRDLAYAFGGMATDVNVAPLLQKIRTEMLPAFGELFAKINDQLMPTLVDLATALAQLFANLDFSALFLLIEGITKLVQGLVWLTQNVPGASFVLSALLTTLFLIGPAFKIASFAMTAFGRAAQVFTFLSVNIRTAFALMSMATGPVGVISRAILSVVGIIKGVFFGALRAIPWLLRAAFLATPIGWIVLAISAVVAAFIWCYNNVEWFRDGVNNALKAVGGWFVWLWEKAKEAFGAIGSWISDQWNNWIKPTLDVMWTVLKVLGAILFVILVAPFVIAWNIISDAIVDTWNQRIKPTLQFFGDIFTWLWTNAIEPALGWISRRWADLGTALQWVYDNAIKPAIQFFADLITWLNENAVQPALGWISRRWADLGTAFQWVYDNAIRPAIQFFADILSWLNTTIVQPVMGWIMDRWAWLGNAMEVVRVNVIDPMFNGIAAGLDWLKGVFDGAVKIIGDIWNGLRNKLAVPINFVIDKVWNNGILAVWNWVAEKIGLPTGKPLGLIPEYAAGGAIRGPGTGKSDSIPAMVSNGEHVWTAEEVKRAGGHEKVQRLRRMARTGSLPYYAEGGPVTPQDMLNTVRGSIPGARLTSGYRPGDPGWHGKNRAADLAGLSSGDTGTMRAIDQFIGTKFPGSAELIHTPGPYNIKNGRPFTYSSAVRADHYDHVHWANNGSSGGGGGILGFIAGAAWDWAKPILNGIIDPIINGIPFAGPPQFMDIPKRMATTAKEGLFGWIEKKINEWGGGGDGAYGGAAGSPEVMAALQAAAARYGWGSGNNWNSLTSLVKGESGFNPNAQNPTSTAYGLFQFLNSTWGTVGGTKTSNPALQSEYGMRYIKNKYGTPGNAYSMWSSRSPHWYDEGGMLPTGLSMVMNGTGAPEPVFTSAQWDQLNPTGLIEAMHATPPSLEARGASEREDALLAAVHGLARALDERPPPMNVDGSRTKAAVLEALREDRRERDARGRYQYGE